ncbi:unnamed protein product [Zymoseptoria tritici ST99CH_1A5]|uniref:Uncharacterized protein n=3 Tax=Zymoseptoria tritici TaxID=1047171 RepID=F9X7H2_ZYMTI|nr:uncharacterized protein MYCGRDRAFT_108892 [Zymoseptoria tritici IPO323]EGP89146.1 hypothetical protein MYCGRDRAFT_108892 [Zymoseptoria tritici IPO323]SMR49252.1 unnamed protein product [Zymoseptoria tritici ST99CH_1E4]SMY23121.1 unnamed protein product [Zymoseptoria tritici ST99CH_1A5]
MADDFDYDLDGFDDDAWLYVDDEFDLADELAEGQVPEPGYAGNNAEIDNDFYDYEFYHYWDDLEYGDDAYWDVGLSGDRDNKVGVKRKRSELKKTEGVVDKRGRTNSFNREAYTREQDPLIFCSRAERNHPRNPDMLRKGTAAFSLLPDWRKRFAREDGWVDHKEMPTDMKRAAEAGVLESPIKSRQAGITLEDDGDEDWEDDEEENGEEGAPTLDLDMLKEVLKQKLGDAGLDGMDENAFMETITKMLSSGNDADDAAGELANSLLGKLTSDSDASEGAALSGWLSQQGVALGDANEEDDASSVATVELPASHRRAAAKEQDRITDMAHEARRETARNGVSFEMASHAASPGKGVSTARKRTAEAVLEGEKPAKRTKKVAFDVPLTPADPATSPADQTESLLTSEDPLMSAPTLASESITASRTSTATSKRAGSQPTTVAPAARKPTSTSRKRKATLEKEPPPEKKTRTSTRAAAKPQQIPDATDAQTSDSRSTRSRATKRAK